MQWIRKIKKDFYYPIIFCIVFIDSKNLSFKLLYLFLFFKHLMDLTKMPLSQHKKRAHAISYNEPVTEQLIWKAYQVKHNTFYSYFNLQVLNMWFIIVWFDPNHCCYLSNVLLVLFTNLRCYILYLILLLFIIVNICYYYNVLHQRFLFLSIKFESFLICSCSIITY